MKKSKINKTRKNHAAISPTAIDVAYVRSLTDIPYSWEIFDFLKNKKGVTGLLPSDNKFSSGISFMNKERMPYFEARYKTIDKTLAKTGIKNVLEIASGMSSRGMDMTKNKSVNFVELDLPEIISYKKQIVKKILGKEFWKRTNLHFYGANALDKGEFMKAAEIFRTGPVAIICEGLLRYLTKKEKKILIRNIHSVLSSRGGVWITPDFGTRDDFRSKSSEERMKLTSKLTKTNIYKNLFKDKKEAISFYNKAGFQVKIIPLVPFKNLSITKKLKLKLKDINKEIGERQAIKLWIKK